MSDEKKLENVRFRAPWVIFWVGFGLRVASILIGRTYMVTPRDQHWDWGAEAGRIAQSLVTGHGFGNPFNGVSGPTAWLGPLFPLLMALAFKLFGVYTHAAVLFVMVVDSAFSAAIAPAVYEIGARCFDAQGLGRRASTKAAPVALWSAWLWAAYPAALQYAIHWVWEMSLSTCLFAWALVVALRLRRIGEDAGSSGFSGNPHLIKRDVGHPSGATAAAEWKLWVAFGILWGLIALSNATLVLVAGASIVWGLWPRVKSRVGLGRGVAGAVLGCVLVGAVMTPWVVRNERVFHAFVPTRSNFGVELWNATLWYHDAFPWGSAVPLTASMPEFRQFASMGEVAYGKMRGEQARANIKAHPGLYVKYTLLRVQYFWFGSPRSDDGKPWNEFFRILNFSFLSVSGVLGLLLALKRRVPGAWLMASVFGLVPLAYYAVTVQARFRHPIEPLICVLSVYLFRASGAKAASS